MKFVRDTARLAYGEQDLKRTVSEREIPGRYGVVNNPQGGSLL
jgi:hypothetical protein